MLAKRLTQRGIVFSGGSVTAVLSAGSASASAPPALVASTIKVASLLAAGRAAGIVSAKVAALTDGVVKTMFVTKIKSVLAVVLVVVATVGLGAGLVAYGTAQGQQSEGKKGDATAPQKADSKPKAQTDNEAIQGTWHIIAMEVGGKAQPKATFEDVKMRLVVRGDKLDIMTTTPDGRDVGEQGLTFKLDEKASPKRFDVSKRELTGLGIYAFEKGHLKLCIDLEGENRPTSFTTKEGTRQRSYILQKMDDKEKAKEEQPAAKAGEKARAKSDQERMVGDWVIKSADSKRQGELWIISKDRILMNAYGPGALAAQYHFLDPGKDPKQIDITFTPVNGPHAINGIYLLDGDELRLCLGDKGKDRPVAFPKKPAPGEVLILHRQ
jgi:uncharacterized protein (TIGR03067 family)